MTFRLFIAAALSILASTPAAAQFSQFVGFGDSTVDSGWYRNTTTGDPDRDKRIAAAVAAGGRGTPVGVGLMSSELLAGYFGLTALPANQAGGTNFATGGARDSQSTGRQHRRSRRSRRSPTTSRRRAAMPMRARSI